MQKSPQTIVIVGATSSIAEHCARIWLAQGTTRLVLVGRDEKRTTQLAADLRVRSPDTDIVVLHGDFSHPHAIRHIVDTIVAQGHPHQVLIAHGYLPEQTDCQENLEAAQDALHLNGISPVLFAEAFARHMELANCGTLGIIGSVAGDRGRKSNYIYGAAKGLVARYAQGLQHRFANHAVKVVLIKPGPTDTPMTAHLKAQGAQLARPQNVAKTIVQGMKRGQPTVYVPGKWRWIMLIIIHIPHTIFKKINI